MNEELKKCVENITNAIAGIKAMDNIMISDIYALKNEYGLSNEMVRLIFCLK